MGYDTIQGRYILNTEQFGAIRYNAIWYNSKHLFNVDINILM